MQGGRGSKGHRVAGRGIERKRDTAESKGDGEGVKGRHKMINHLAGALGLETHTQHSTHTHIETKRNGTQKGFALTRNYLT